MVNSGLASCLYAITKSSTVPVLPSNPGRVSTCGALREAAGSAALATAAWWPAALGIWMRRLVVEVNMLPMNVENRKMDMITDFMFLGA